MLINLKLYKFKKLVSNSLFLTCTLSPPKKKKTHSKMSEGQKTGIISNTDTNVFIPICKCRMELHYLTLWFHVKFCSWKKMLLETESCCSGVPKWSWKKVPHLSWETYTEDLTAHNRTAEVGSSGLGPLLKQSAGASPGQAALTDCIQSGLKCLHGWRLHSLSRQPVAMFKLQCQITGISVSSTLLLTLFL